MLLLQLYCAHGLSVYPNPLSFLMAVQLWHLDILEKLVLHCPLHSRTFSSIPGYPLTASETPYSLTVNHVFSLSHMFLGASHPSLSTTGQNKDCARRLTSMTYDSSASVLMTQGEATGQAASSCSQMTSWKLVLNMSHAKRLHSLH